MYKPQVVAEKEYIAAALDIDYKSLSQAYLRAETLLVTQNSISFIVQRGQTQTPLVTERLLNLNDKFVITHVFIGLKKITTASPTEAEQAAASVYTYENPFIFDGVAGDQNVKGIYNGSFSMTIDRTQFLPQIPVRSFRRVPQTQQHAAITDVLPAEIDEYANGLYGFYPIEPVVIDGRQTLDLTIDLGATLDTQEGTENNYAVLEFRGYLVTNAKN